MKTTFKSAIAALFVLSSFLIFSGCADPRNEPPTAADPAFTETIVLWEDVVSGGTEITSTFEVASALAPINQPGVDAPARLTISAFIAPDSDTQWRERIIADSTPYWSDPNAGFLVHYQIEISNGESILDEIAAIRALCDSLPDQCPDDTSGLLEAEADAQAYVNLYQDSLNLGIADTTRLGMVRDSLGAVLDNRFTLALWLDDDPLTVYPGGVFLNETTLGGQSIYSASAGGTVMIEINLDYPGGVWDTLFASTTNDGVERWVVDDSMASSAARVRVTSEQDPAATDISDANFSILSANLSSRDPEGRFGLLWEIIDVFRPIPNSTDDAELSVLYPNGGESWTEQTARSVMWNSVFVGNDGLHNGYKAKTFRLNLAQFDAADVNFPTRPIEINWLSRLSEGPHTLRARLNGSGADTRITGTIVLVYAEERN